LKKTALLLALALTSTMANASSSFVSLGNYQYSITGPGISFISGYARAFTELSLNFDNDYALIKAPDYEFDVSATSEDSRGGSYADADNAISEPDSSIKSFVDITSGYGVARSFATYSLNYLANTLLTFSVDASFINTGNAGDQITGAGVIGLFDNLHTSPEKIQFYTNGALNGTMDKFFSISYSSPVNSVLTIYAQTESRLFTAPPITAVPEPETYALMISGLGIMGFVARLRSKSV